MLGADMLGGTLPEPWCIHARGPNSPAAALQAQWDVVVVARTLPED